MERAEAIERLPVTYRRLHRWLEAGVPDDVVAARLGVPVEALPGLVSVAFAKLANIQAADTVGGVDSGSAVGP